MRILRTTLFSLIFIALSCSLMSCDSLEEGTVLYRILRELKFHVTEISAVYPARLNRYDVLFLQALDKTPTETEVQEIHAFVHTGGTLIVAADDPVLDRLFSVFGLKLRELPKRLKFARRIPDEPFFPQHPVDDIRPRTNFAIDSLEREVATLYGTENNAVIVTLRHGEGRAFFIASDYLFDKYGLGHSGNATFLYNLMSTLPRNARIGLAEERYYTLESKPPNPFAALLFRTPGGLSAVYICLTLFIFLLLRGRRLGKPLDMHEKSRRLSSEYVHAMTALYQKGNTRTEILKHIRDTFRADLGIRWRVNPNLETATFLAELAQRGAIDENDEQLTQLVTDMEPTGNISEAQLLDIAQRVEAYRETARLGGRRLNARRHL